MSIFNPEMLLLARTARGLTQKVLVEKTGIGQSTLSKIEQGILAPSSEYLGLIAETLGFSIQFFMQSDGFYRPGMKYYRKRVSVGERLCKKIDAENNIRGLIIKKLLDDVVFEGMGTLPSLPLDEADRTPEIVAQTVREHWSLPRGPIRNLTNLVERNGACVVHADFGTTKFDGVYYRFANVMPIIFLNKRFPADRLRYSLSHEIGHVVMHQRSTSPETVEEEANRFAAELLMPAKDIRPYLKRPTLDSLAGLKAVWRVSMHALARRAWDLETISKSTYQRLIIQIRSLTRSAAEPAETEFEREVPTLISKVIARYIDEYDYSLENLLEAIHHCEPSFLHDLGAEQSKQNILYLNVAKE